MEKPIMPQRTTPMPAVLNDPYLEMTIVGRPRQDEITCTGDCCTPHGRRRKTLHRISPATVNGDAGWFECVCLVCQAITYWHFASNWEFRAHRAAPDDLPENIVGRRLLPTGNKATVIAGPWPQ